MRVLTLCCVVFVAGLTEIGYTAEDGLIEVSGRVVRADGSPAIGGRILTMRPSYEVLDSWTVDDEGHFSGRVETLPIRVLALVPGAEPTYSAILERAPVPTVEIVVGAGRSVAGRVVSIDGKPIGNASVNWLPAPTESEPVLPYGVAPAPITTDANGTFHMQGLPKDPITLHAWHDNFLVASLAEITSDASEPNDDNSHDTQEHEYTFQLSSARWLVATIPAEVPKSMISSRESGSWWIDESSVAAELGTRIRSAAMKPEAGTGTVGFPGTTTVPISWPSGVGEYDLGVVPIGLGNIVRVKVLDPSGAPLHDAAVWLDHPPPGSWCGNSWDGASPIITTAADGLVQFTAVRPGDHELGVHHESYTPEKSHFEIESPLTELTVTMHIGGRVRGQLLVDREAEPTLYLFESASNPDEFPDRHFPDEDGLFDIPFAAGKTVDLVYTAQGFVPTRVAELQIEAGEMIDLGALVLDPGLTLSGVVVDDKGDPVPDFYLSLEEYVGDGSDLERFWMRPRVNVTDQGTFGSSGYRPGRYTFSTFGDEFLDTKQVVELTRSQSVKLAFSRGIQLDGELVYPDGSPVLARDPSSWDERGGDLSVRLTVWQRTERGGSWPTDGKTRPGGFSASGLRDRPTTLVFEVEDGTIKRRFHADHPDELPKRVVIPRPAGLTVTIEADPEGRYFVHAIDRRGRVHTFSSTNFPDENAETAEVKAIGLEPGSYQVIVGGHGWSSAPPLDIVVQEGEQREFSVALDPAPAKERFELEVLQCDGEPAAGAWWQLRDIFDGEYLESGKCDDEGRAVVAHHPGTAAWLQVGGMAVSRTWVRDPVSRCRNGVLTVRGVGDSALAIKLEHAGSHWFGAENVRLEPIDVRSDHPDLSAWLFRNDARQSYSRGELPTGRYRVLVLAGDRSDAMVLTESEVRLTEGPTTEITLELPPHTTVNGQLRVAGIAGTGQLTATAHRDGRRYRTLAPVVAGEFQLRLPFVGTFAFEFEPADREPTRSIEGVVEGDSLRLEFD